MRHLATKREAAERRRAALMSKGISDFLSRASQSREASSSPQSDAGEYASSEFTLRQNPPLHEDPTGPVGSIDPRGGSIVDKIRVTLDHAAEILRESLELHNGGVVFLDCGSGQAPQVEIEAAAEPFNSESRENESIEQASRPTFTREDHRHLSQTAIRGSDDSTNPLKVLAMCTEFDTWDSKSKLLNSNTIASLVKSHPKGNIWSINDTGLYSSLNQISEWEKRGVSSLSERRKSVSPVEMARYRVEARTLSELFPQARQLMFLPVWDAGGGKSPGIV